MVAFLRELRQSVRGVWKTPVFLVAASLSLALGIGANLAIFSVLKAAVAPDLPYAAPHNLVAVKPTVSHAVFQQWLEDRAVMVHLAAYRAMDEVLRGTDQPVGVRAIETTPQFWSVLSVTPTLGRLPAESDSNFLVVSHRVWSTHMGSDRGALGRTFTVGNRSLTLVAVLPTTADWGEQAIFVPFHLREGETHPGNAFLNVLGRVRPGVGWDRVRAACQTLTTTLRAAYPAYRKDTVTALPYLESQNARYRDSQRVLGWIALLVTSLACLNLAMLVMGRSVSRLPELRIRRALGASFSRLFGLLFADVLVASAPGLALGWLLAFLTGPLMSGFLPRSLRVFREPSLADVAPALAISLLITTVASLLPALLLPRLKGLAALGSARLSAGRHHRLGQQFLVASQIAVTLVLLSGSSMLYLSLRHLQESPTGARLDGRLAFTLPAPENEVAASRRPSEVAQVLERIRALPGVHAAGAGSNLPTLGGSSGSMPLPGSSERIHYSNSVISPGYLEALGVPLVEGRYFEPRDLVPGAPIVTIVSRSFAKAWSPDRTLAGQRLGDTVQFVGVVEDVNMLGAGMSASRTNMYFPGTHRDLVVACDRAPQAVAAEVDRVLREQWRHLPHEPGRPLREVMDGAFQERGRQAALFGILTALALLLTLAGIYGVIDRQVQERRKEVGIRLALGGRGIGVSLLLARQSFHAVALGALAGLAGSFALARVLQNQLVGVRPGDPASHLGALLFLLAVTLVASLLPALQVTRVAAVEVLRSE